MKRWDTFEAKASRGISLYRRRANFFKIDNTANMKIVDVTVWILQEADAKIEMGVLRHLFGGKLWKGEREPGVNREILRPYCRSDICDNTGRRKADGGGRVSDSNAALRKSHLDKW